jgi:hypothetical protein
LLAVFIGWGSFGFLNFAVAEPPGKLVNQISWKSLDERKKLDSRCSVDKDENEGTVLKIMRGANDPQLIPLVTIENPGVTEKGYLLSGKVRFSGVKGEGFVEMWSHFPEPKPGAYFSRTMAESGPMGKLRGESPWRELQLPFMIDQGDFPNPSKLQINVFLPETGSVWLTDLRVTEMPLKDLQRQLSVSGSSAAWWLPMLTIGALGFIGSLGIAVTCLIVARWRRSHSMELRRMQALDLGT